MSCLLSVGVPAVISMLEMGAQGIVQLLLDRESLKPFGAAIGLPIGSHRESFGRRAERPSR